MHRITLVFALATLLLTSPAAADLPAPGGASPATGDAYARFGLLEEGQRPRGGGLFGSSFLDRSRLSFRHSLSYGYTSSGGGQSAGLWIGEIGYRLADPLHLSLDVGAAITPGDQSLVDGRNIFLHGLDLDYRPGRHFRMSISYRNVPDSAAPAYWMNRGAYGIGGTWWGDDDAPYPDRERPARP